MFKVRVTAFGTTPGVIHAQGYHSHKPLLRAIQKADLSTRYDAVLLPEGLTILTCNNGHPSMGCLEQSLARMDIPCRTCGQGMIPWINSVHKPAAIAEALQQIDTEYTLYADSRDAFLITPPSLLLDRYRAHFSCDLLFGGDRLSYPPDSSCAAYEENLPGADATEFKYLNGGAWIGKTRFAQTFFESATKSCPLAIAPQSEQGILRQLLPQFGQSINIDHRCEIFLNVGFIFNSNTITVDQTFD